MPGKLSRRGFLKSAAFSIAAMKTGPAFARSLDANEKLNIAIVGIGGQGDYSYRNVRSENLVAVADVDTARAGGPYAQFEKSRQFTDYRRMLDRMHKSIDAVIVATPDHTHFHPAYMAMDLGKHLYLEKPMAHNVWEVRTLTELAAHKGVATQLGMQRHVKDNMHRVTELVRAGSIGDVIEVHSWVDSERGMVPRIPEAPPVPPTLDYDLWLGPVEHKPYDPNITPYGWRFWWSFGTGEAGNWGCHILDIPFDALQLDYPTRAGATGPDPHREMTTQSMHAWFEFPARGARKALTLHWYQAKGGPGILEQYGLSASRNNTLFVGTRGILLCGFDQRTLLQQSPDGAWETKLTQDDPMDFDVPPQTVPDSPGFHREFLNACKGDATPPTCNFRYSGPITETVLLGNVAYRARSAFDWDHTTLTCVNAPAAQAYIRESYKKGWELG